MPRLFTPAEYQRSRYMSDPEYKRKKIRSHRISRLKRQILRLVGEIKKREDELLKLTSEA